MVDERAEAFDKAEEEEAIEQEEQIVDLIDNLSGGGEDHEEGPEKTKKDLEEEGGEKDRAEAALEKDKGDREEREESGEVDLDAETKLKVEAEAKTAEELEAEKKVEEEEEEAKKKEEEQAKLNADEKKGEVEGDELPEPTERELALMNKIDELSQKLNLGPVTIPKVDDKSKEKVETEVKVEAPVVDPGKPIDFVGDLDIDDVASDKETLNKVLNEVMKHATVNIATNVLKSIPGIVMNQTAEHMNIKTATDEFYGENKDLLPVRNVVANVANQLHADSPDLTIPEIFTQAAVKTREVLGMKKQAEKVVERANKKRTPSLVKKVTSSDRTTKTGQPSSTLQSEVDDIINL